jgi:sigma-54-specific transcriptional regulator
MLSGFDMFETCVALAAHRDPAALRRSIAADFARMVDASAVVLLGLSEARDEFAVLAGAPDLHGISGIPLCDGEDNMHAATLLSLPQFSSGLADVRNLSLAAIRCMMFPGVRDAGLVVVKGFVGQSLEIILLALRHDRLEVDGSLERQLCRFADFCASQTTVIATLHCCLVENAGFARSMRRADDDRKALRAQIPDLMANRIVGASPQTASLRGEIARFGPSDLAVLITGETGTGKELVARELHQVSSRRARPFVAINIAALSDDLATAELFGHAKGAYTGADRARPGLIDAADGGTLFLDEMGDISLTLQAKLLRVLQDRSYRAVGDTRERRSNFRLICATHRDLRAMIEKELFRADLFFRLAQLRIAVAPLRERAGDSLILAEYFLNEISRREGKLLKGFSKQAADRIRQYPYPGNVRELQGAIERACLQSSGPLIEQIDFETCGLEARGAIGAADAQGDLAIGSYGSGLRDACDNFERVILGKALRSFAGNRTLAAAHLRIPVSTLRDKMRQHGLAQAHYREAQS